MCRIEPCICAREPYVGHDTLILSLMRVLEDFEYRTLTLYYHISVKEPYISAKLSCKYGNQSCLNILSLRQISCRYLQKSPICLQESPSYPESSPIPAQSSPICLQKNPIIYLQMSHISFCRRVYISRIELCICAKEPYLSEKESYLLLQETPTCVESSPVSAQESPMSDMTPSHSH